MKFNLVIENLQKDEVIYSAKSVANSKNLEWDIGIETILAACCDNISLAPKIGGKKDNQEQVIGKWISKYWKGYDNRMSRRISNPPGTVDKHVYSVKQYK